jgi:uncharacterized protein
MIHSFKFKNFYSFQKESTVSFVVNENAPNTHGYITTPLNTKLSNIEVVIGPNASGKTNVLKVLPFIKWLITDSYGAHPDDPIPVKSFLFKKNTPIELSVDFELNSKIYSYRFLLTEERILEEELFYKTETVSRVTKKMIFSRKWDVKLGAFIFNKKSHFKLPKNIESMLRKNTSVIASAIRIPHRESQEIDTYWRQIDTNVIEAGWIGDHIIPNSNLMFETINFFHENKEFKKKAEKLLAKFDLGLEALEIKKEQIGNQTNMNVQTVHAINGDKIHFNFNYESSGTRQFLILLKIVLQSLSRGGIAVIDEFDTNLHPDMIAALVDMFIFPETNPFKAQLIFSTHSHRILNKLDKYQIMFVEKNKKGSSEIWRLDEMEGVRADDNYYRKYIAGAYGAIPNIQ